MRLLLTASIALLALAATAQDVNPISDDIIATYTDMIARKPSSYDLYLSRATEYLSRGLLAPALTDLNDALRLAPGGEKGIRFEILSQRANILERQMDYDAALADLNEASTLYPDSPTTLLAKGRVLTALGRYDEAREVFNKARRAIPRSPEAFFGLAKAAALSGDTDNALGYANEGVELAPAAGTSYIARAEIYKLLGRRKEAIAQYLAALGCNDEGAGKALQVLADISYDGYPEVMAAFDKAINDNPTSGSLYYLRATMAQAHDHHQPAMADFTMIDGAGPFANGTLGESKAESLLALDRAEEALKAVDGLPVRAQAASSEALRARILLRLGQADAALAAAEKATALDDQSAPAQMAYARALMAAGRNEEASAALATLIMLDPISIPEAYFMRATLLPQARREMMMEQVLDLPYEPADPTSLRGFALLDLGRKDEAVIWANTIMRLDSAQDGTAPATAAALLARAGMAEQALEALRRAVELGYDRELLTPSEHAPELTRPLRALPGYDDIVKR